MASAWSDDENDVWLSEKESNAFSWADEVENESVQVPIALPPKEKVYKPAPWANFKNETSRDDLKEIQNEQLVIKDQEFKRQQNKERKKMKRREENRAEEKEIREMYATRKATEDRKPIQLPKPRKKFTPRQPVLNEFLPLPKKK